MKFQAAIVISALCGLVFLPAVSLAKSNPGAKPNAAAASKSNAGTKTNSASRKEVSALQIDQTHIYLGKLKVLLTPEAIKMVGLGKFHFTLVSTAPQWNVTVYREDDKLYCTQTASEFYNTGGLFSSMVMIQKERMLPPNSKFVKETLSGFVVERYGWGNVVFKCLPLGSYTVPQAERILHASYKLPTNGGIPLAFVAIMQGNDWMTQLSEKGLHRAFLDTQKISKCRVSVPEFDVPPGLTSTNSVTRIVAGDIKQLEDTGVDYLLK